MTASRLLYLQRSDRGARLDGLRLVGVRTDHAWTAPETTRPDHTGDEAEDGADWVREQLTGSAREVSAVCLDTDGAVCTWIHSPAGDPDAARIMIEDAQRAAGFDPDDPDGGTSAGRYPGLAGEAGVHPIAPPSGGDAERVPVLVMPDPSVRLLLDALDRRRVVAGSVCSLWHAIAWAWDAPPSTTTSDARTIASASVCAATIVIDPIGRAVWAWSCGGSLIAGGTLRLRGEPGNARLTVDDIPRLANDWLGWAAQLGVTPQRIVVVGPLGEPIHPHLEAAGARPDERAGEEPERPHRPACDAGSLGRALSARWPDAPADLVDEPDPIGATLRRAAERFEDGPSPAGPGSDSSLPVLTARPTRLHRGMYLWAGLAMALAGGLLLAGAFVVHTRGEAFRRDAAATRAERRAVLEALDAIASFNPPLAIAPFAEQSLQAQVQRLAGSSTTTNDEVARPILPELENLVLVIGGAGVVMDDISLSRPLVVLKVTVPDTQTMEELFAALRGVRSQIQWTNRTFGRSVRRDGAEWSQWTFTGQWAEPSNGLSSSNASEGGS